MKSRVVSVKAIWDKDAQVWIAISEDVPGLVTEADTLEQLIEKLRVMIPELLEANGLLLGNSEEKILFHLLSERIEMAKAGV
jgi:predicted RNase H-like HicB family nuclease